MSKAEFEKERRVTIRRLLQFLLALAGSMITLLVLIFIMDMVMVLTTSLKMTDITEGFVYQAILGAPFLLLGCVLGTSMVKRQMMHRLSEKLGFGFLIGLIAYILLNSSVPSDDVHIIFPLVAGLIYTGSLMVFFIINIFD
ncbi:hypothetical protein SFC66_11330 [Terribacillus saccharophilus]|uniref:hypothetical protein n=1 Tax=Terribacillus saccharophilus TaxID=361277 RepID=UPI00398229C0